MTRNNIFNSTLPHIFINRLFDNRRFSADNRDDVLGSHRLQIGHVALRGEMVWQFQTEASWSLGNRSGWNAGDQLFWETSAWFVWHGSPNTSGAQKRMKEFLSRNRIVLNTYKYTFYFRQICSFSKNNEKNDNKWCFLLN